jgi:hypothetical protein
MGVKLHLLLCEKNINYDFYNKMLRKGLRPKKDKVNRKFSILHNKNFFIYASHQPFLSWWTSGGCSEVGV